MSHLDTAAGTDRGRVRPRNEDAYHLGLSVFAVADGMGGHLAGDVAAVTALLPIKGLDGKTFGDEHSAHAALVDAILAANAAVVGKAAREPSLHGMGTTLTATIVMGRRLHVGHVGDSRAYLLRDSELVQLTRDHTLVARLIEEGRITKEEAAIHPQRSVITRAIGVDVDLDIDTLTIDLQDGDQVMLCSDGLTGPVPDEQIELTLEGGLGAEDAVSRLIALANQRGGPDNITVVLLRFREDEAHGDGHSSTTLIRPDMTGSDLHHNDWVAALGRYGRLNRLRDVDRREAPTGRVRGGRRIVVVTVLVMLLLAAIAAGAWGVLSRSYFVGIDGRTVAIFRGVPVSLGPLELSWVIERTNLDVDEVAAWYVEERLRPGVVAADLADARRLVRDVVPRADPPNARNQLTPVASPPAT